MTYFSSTQRVSRFSQILSHSKTFTAALLLGAQSLACGAAPAANEVEGSNVCSTDAECAAGESCGDDGVCGPLACTATTDCPEGTSCGPDGYCYVDVDNGGDEQAACDPSALCVTGEIDLENQTPTIMLLIDQSGSMEENFGDTTRWLALRDALVNPDTGIIAGMQDSVRFGVALFSGNGRYDAGQCPSLVGLDEIQVDFGNYEQIAQVYNQASPRRDTPTGESLAAVTDYLLNLDVPGPKAIVLATDGEPDTCDDPDAHNQDTNDFVVATAQASFRAGISTYVLSVGDDVGTPHLEDLANAGVGYEVDGEEQAPYFQANDQAELQAELSRIVSGIRSCSLELSGDVSESVVAQGVVRVDERELEYGVDWQLVAPNQIQLLGDACAATAAGEHTVTADFPCECEAPAPEYVY